jgi:hypothetical protein
MLGSNFYSVLGSTKIKFLLVAIISVTILTQARAQGSAPSSLGVYGKISEYCGANEIARNVQNIPAIGCFYLSAGHSAIGTFASHRVSVSVDDAGKEVFTVDGVLVVETHDTASGTILAYIGIAGVAGYRICEGPTDNYTGCPTDITVYARNSDKTILFMVSECIAPKFYVCVSTQENWNYEKSRPH